ncbi:LRR repeats and ubiquitin-like domain-containing protein [Apostasia shenzhenica]|uniref:LRR repeats and ubiquitin-like domain-containing protein n=1 Tax=Apostasia shenzhenica TaxID=1088818 RepID=A0A2H9ZVJ5_9ASPA|nr:LRR repeats and ubiquitin-like domain-containing protein [Apostasia shenzhenica]
MGPSLDSIDGVVEEIMRIHRSLPARPSIDEVEAAATLIRNMEREEEAQVDAISKQKKGFHIPEELFSILQEMQKKFVCFQHKEQKREALRLLELENDHILFDELIQRTSGCLPSRSEEPASSSSFHMSSMSSTKSSGSNLKSDFRSLVSVNGYEKEFARCAEQSSRDDSYVKRPKPTLYADGSSVDFSASQGLFLKSAPSARPAANSGEEGDKLSLIRLASLIEVSAKKGSQELNLQNKLMDQIEWIPDSIGKLSGLVSFNMSENRIVVLPMTIGSLSSLKKLDLHTNRISELPDSIGDLISLLYLNVCGNQLTSLPSTIGKLHQLEYLDLGSNQISLLPETIESLVSLKRLNVERNNIEELPYTIGNCTSLMEVRADYNRLKALPEAIGKLKSLQVLTVRYNNIKGLPTTMAFLLNLKEVDASFNELESISESLCLATSLTKLNIGNNFANLQSLPRSIGNLEMLEGLDISNNQIRVLPDSFGMLLQLRVLHADENPLELPPRHIVEKGAQAVVQYMAEVTAKRDLKPQATKNTWADCCFFSTPVKQKSDGWDYVN